jgi:hypothetical protein
MLDFWQVQDVSKRVFKNMLVLSTLLPHKVKDVRFPQILILTNSLFQMVLDFVGFGVKSNILAHHLFFKLCSLLGVSWDFELSHLTESSIILFIQVSKVNCFLTIDLPAEVFVSHPVEYMEHVQRLVDVHKLRTLSEVIVRSNRRYHVAFHLLLHSSDLHI